LELAQNFFEVDKVKAGVSNFFLICVGDDHMEAVFQAALDAALNFQVRD
jgi:hypothetical protein